MCKLCGVVIFSLPAVSLFDLYAGCINVSVCATEMHTVSCVIEFSCPVHVWVSDCKTKHIYVFLHVCVYMSYICVCVCLSQRETKTFPVSQR